MEEAEIGLSEKYQLLVEQFTKQELENADLKLMVRQYQNKINLLESCTNNSHSLQPLASLFRLYEDDVQKLETTNQVLLEENKHLADEYHNLLLILQSKNSDIQQTYTGDSMLKLLDKFSDVEESDAINLDHNFIVEAKVSKTLRDQKRKLDRILKENEKLQQENYHYRKMTRASWHLRKFLNDTMKQMEFYKKKSEDISNLLEQKIQKYKSMKSKLKEYESNHENMKHTTTKFELENIELKKQASDFDQKFEDFKRQYKANLLMDASFKRLEEEQPIANAQKNKKLIELHFLNLEKLVRQSSHLQGTKEAISLLKKDFETLQTEVMELAIREKDYIKLLMEYNEEKVKHYEQALQPTTVTSSSKHTKSIGSTNSRSNTPTNSSRRSVMNLSEIRSFNNYSNLQSINRNSSIA